MNYIAVDIGTTSIKGMLYQENGIVLSKASLNTKTYSIAENKEQNPFEIFDAVCKIIAKLAHHSCTEKIGFVSFSCYMHSLMAVDKNGEPLTHCMLWSDNRSAKISERYRKNGVGLSLYKKTGTPIHPMSPFYKILWLKENDKALFDQTCKFISMKEFLFFKFFNQFAVDYSIASATGLFNIFSLDWDNEALNILGLSKNNFSSIHDATFYFDNLNVKLCEILGVSTDTKFVLGASDGCCANLGSNGVHKTGGVISIGTSAAVRITTKKPVIDADGRTFSYVLKKGLYVSGGASNNGGNIFAWYQKSFGNISSIDDELSKTNTGANGLLFLPYLNGERAPYWNPFIRGAFFGVSDNHSKLDFLRAAIEGSCFIIRDMCANFSDAISEFYVNGGFVQSKKWVEILSSVLNKKLVIAETYEAACLGAFFIGLLACNKIQDFSGIEKLIKTQTEVFPNAKDVVVYDDIFSVYQKSVCKVQEISNLLEARRFLCLNN